MLIHSISLKNFKCFREVDIDFSKITLLTGANSSGKSSLIYGILACLQTENFPFYLSPNGSYVDMGGFEEMVFKNDRQEKIAINFTFENQYPFFYGDYFSIRTTWSENKQNQLTQLSSFDIFLPEAKLSLSEEKLNLVYEYRQPLGTSGAPQFDLQKDKEKFSGGPWDVQYERDGDLQRIRINFQSKSQIDTLFRNIGQLPFLRVFFEAFTYSFEAIGNGFNYIGSFRMPPDRTYYRKAKAQNKIDASGSGYIDQIIEWEETDLESFTQLIQVMREISLLSSIETSRLQGGRFEVRVKTDKFSLSAPLTDVGFGISQFLPVIVGDLQLGRESLLAVSQPEIHLHPKIQATFGNYLANQVKRGSKQYIVETHSEYLLNRMRLLIVKGELQPEDVAVYYMENSENGTVTHRVEFTKDGQIKGAPPGFFETYMIDVMDIAMNAD